MRVLVERGERRLLRRDPVDLVARPLDRPQRLLHGRMGLLVGLDDEDGDGVRERAHWWGSAAASSQYAVKTLISFTRARKVTGLGMRVLAPAS